ncbi:FecR domain-containing protein [Caulobacter sp.]|uniref:FecR family protein n=1 Tax=Caulobacter sp. TaxID=78 RepID=UPI0025BF23E1|nr:FecR domain-containing protein [Caulobacter sp.]MBQ1563433.1 FecR domain-containing protein [Caulobacter sp.]
MTHSPEQGLPDPSQLLAASLTRALTPAEQARLDAWATSSAAARDEVAATREAWMALGLAAEDPAIQRMRSAARRQSGLGRALPRALGRPLSAGLGLAIAATLVAGLALWMRPVERVYTAPAHDAARLTLADGSAVTLSPGGRLETRFTPGHRAVALIRGDAFFAVQHDKARPFTVAVRDRTLTVLGTRFNVSDGESLRVSLVEGSLRVSQPGAASVVLRPGERYLEIGSASAVQAGNVADDAAWTGGRLVLNGATLGEAAQRLSRASGRRVALSDPALATLRLSGSLRITPMEDVGAALEGLLPIQTRLTPAGDLIISPRNSSAHG